MVALDLGSCSCSQNGGYFRVQSRGGANGLAGLGSGLGPRMEPLRSGVARHGVLWYGVDRNRLASGEQKRKLPVIRVQRQGEFLVLWPPRGKQKQGPAVYGLCR